MDDRGIRPGQAPAAEDLLGVLRYCYLEGLPITVKGANLVLGKQGASVSFPLSSVTRYKSLNGLGPYYSLGAVAYCLTDTNTSAAGYLASAEEAKVDKISLVDRTHLLDTLRAPRGDEEVLTTVDSLRRKPRDGGGSPAKKKPVYSPVGGEATPGGSAVSKSVSMMDFTRFSGSPGPSPTSAKSDRMGGKFIDAEFDFNDDEEAKPWSPFTGTSVSTAPTLAMPTNKRDSMPRSVSDQDFNSPSGGPTKGQKKNVTEALAAALAAVRLDDGSPLVPPATAPRESLAKRMKKKGSPATTSPVTATTSTTTAAVAPAPTAQQPAPTGKQARGNKHQQQAHTGSPAVESPMITTATTTTTTSTFTPPISTGSPAPAPAPAQQQGGKGRGKQGKQQPQAKEAPQAKASPKEPAQKAAAAAVPSNPSPAKGKSTPTAAPPAAEPAPQQPVAPVISPQPVRAQQAGKGRGRGAEKAPQVSPAPVATTAVVKEESSPEIIPAPTPVEPAATPAGAGRGKGRGKKGAKAAPAPVAVAPTGAAPQQARTMEEIELGLMPGGGAAAPAPAPKVVSNEPVIPQPAPRSVPPAASAPAKQSTPAHVEPPSPKHAVPPATTATPAQTQVPMQSTVASPLLLPSPSAAAAAAQQQARASPFTVISPPPTATAFSDEKDVINNKDKTPTPVTAGKPSSPPRTPSPKEPRDLEIIRAVGPTPPPRDAEPDADRPESAASGGAGPSGAAAVDANTVAALNKRARQKLKADEKRIAAAMMNSVDTPPPVTPRSLVELTMGSAQQRARTMGGTGLVYDVRMLAHCDPAGYHPEQPARISDIYERLQRDGHVKRCVPIPVREATKKELQTCHTINHIQDMFTLNQLSAKQLKKKSHEYNSVYLNPETSTAAKLSAGGVLELTSRVMRGEVRNGIAVVRPPGHHAEKEKAMGFCIYNNVAVAAAVVTNPSMAETYLHCKPAQRVLIVDWDIHHGNGTQRRFENDPNVLFFSIHRYDRGSFYPGDELKVCIDGDASAVGTEEGRGFNVNVGWNLENGSTDEDGFKLIGDAEYLAVFQRVLMPVAIEFNPDLVIVSAGFDAARGDPLGGCGVTPLGYAHMTEMLLGLANGRVIIALEGGYHLNSIAACASACTAVLLGASPAAAVAPTTPCLDSIAATMKAHLAAGKWFKADQVAAIETELSVRAATKRVRAGGTPGGSGEKGPAPLSPEPEKFLPYTRLQQRQNAAASAAAGAAHADGNDSDDGTAGGTEVFEDASHAADVPAEVIEDEDDVAIVATGKGLGVSGAAPATGGGKNKKKKKKAAAAAGASGSWLF